MRLSFSLSSSFMLRPSVREAIIVNLYPLRVPSLQKNAYLCRRCSHLLTAAYIKRRILLRLAKPKSGKFHRRPMEKTWRSHCLYTQPMRTWHRICRTSVYNTWGYVFTVILQGFSRCPVPMISDSRLHAPFYVKNICI